MVYYRENCIKTRQNQTCSYLKTSRVPARKPDLVQQHVNDGGLERIGRDLRQRRYRVVEALRLHDDRRGLLGDGPPRVAVHQVAEERGAQSRVRHQVLGQIAVVLFRYGRHLAGLRLEDRRFGGRRAARARTGIFRGPVKRVREKNFSEFFFMFLIIFNFTLQKIFTKVWSFVKSILQNQCKT